MAALKPQSKIIKLISHEPMVPAMNPIKDVYEVATRQRVLYNGVPYIDGFGYHVYITTSIDLSGTGMDVDLRGELPELETFKPRRNL